MADELRLLTREGLSQFRSYLEALRADPKLEPPRRILSHPKSSSQLPDSFPLESRSFDTILNAVGYLHDVLETLDPAFLEWNEGIWSWLSLYYFDRVCPVNKQGNRFPGPDYRYILHSRDYRLYFLHVMAGPYMVYKLHGNRAPLLFCSPFPRMNKYYRELCCRQALITNTGVIEAANLLYFDEKKKVPKQGAAGTTRKPGTLFRFLDIVQQLDLNYDLHSMTGEEILSLFPSEFDQWR